jgi:phage terminase large subunit-like protein
VQRSTLDSLLSLPSDQRREVIQSLSDEEALALLYDWEGMWARAKQLEPVLEKPWLFWFLCGGRGSGKTRPAAEWCIKRALAMPGSRGFVAARTLDDVRQTCFEGDSGILSCLNPQVGRQWNRTTCELTIRVGDKGTFLKGFTSEKPAQGRGPQHHWGWADEFAAWLKEGDLWDQLIFGLRLPWEGREAQAVVTSTPLPIKRIRALFKRRDQIIRTPEGREYLDVVITQMTTYENMENLSATYLAIIKEHEGTRLGRQELLAELLEDLPGALWHRAWFDREGFRIERPDPKQLEYVVVAIDPAVTAHEDEEGKDDSDLTGIVAVAKLAHGDWVDAKGRKQSSIPDALEHYAVLADKSQRSEPAVWGRDAIQLFHDLQADLMVGETNRGGDLVAGVLREIDPDVPFLAITASRGKRTRAEPVATIYEQGRSHHVGDLELLEDQLCTWVPGLGDSPDRLDADVYGHTAARSAMRFRLG